MLLFLEICIEIYQELFLSLSLFKNSPTPYQTLLHGIYVHIYDFYSFFLLKIFGI